MVTSVVSEPVPSVTDTFTRYITAGAEDRREIWPVAASMVKNPE